MRHRLRCPPRLTKRVLRRAAAALTAGLCVSSPARGQAEAARPRGWSAGVVAGRADFDLSGTGSTAIAGLRADRALGRFFVAEAAVGVMRPREQYDQRFVHAMPEVQLQAQLPLGRVRPYLGVGGGASITPGRPPVYRFESPGLRVTIPYGSPFDATFSAGAGARADVTRAVGLRGEVRLRLMGAGFVAESTLGVARRF